MTRVVTITGGAGATLVLGDSLELMRDLAPAMGVKACICDPPYSINTKSDGGGKLSPWADLCNSAFWYAEWMRIVRSRLRQDGCLLTFHNWRSMVVFQKAAIDARWAIESEVIWDKRYMGAGGTVGFRPSYEMFALLAQPEFALGNRGLRDVVEYPWSGARPGGHPAEKPSELMAMLVAETTSPGDLVLDPFMGSGTVGEACLALGRRYIGFEIDEGWFDHSVARLTDSLRQQPLFPEVCNV